MPQGRGRGRKARDSTRRRGVVGGGSPLAALPLGATPSGESRPAHPRHRHPRPLAPHTAAAAARGGGAVTGETAVGGAAAAATGGATGCAGSAAAGMGRRGRRRGRLGSAAGQRWAPPLSAPPPPPSAPPRPAIPAARWRPASEGWRRRRRPAASWLRRLPPVCGTRRAGGWLGVVGVAVVVSWAGGWGVLGGGGCPPLEAPRPRSPAAPALRPSPPTLGRAAAAAWWRPRRRLVAAQAAAATGSAAGRGGRLGGGGGWRPRRRGWCWRRGALHHPAGAPQPLAALPPGRMVRSTGRRPQRWPRPAVRRLGRVVWWR